MAKQVKKVYLDITYPEVPFQGVAGENFNTHLLAIINAGCSANGKTCDHIHSGGLLGMYCAEEVLEIT